jgi:hemerythrin-like domain-containing protein
MSAQRKAPSRSRSKSGTTRSRGAARGEMDLFSLLKEDHKKVKDLFEQIEEDGETEMEFQGDLFSQIEDELQLHMDGEEGFFYPALEKSEKTHEKALESYEEHHVAKMVLGEFSDLAQDDERWKAKIKVLKELVTHHIEEEEKEIFKIAQKVLDRGEIEQIGKQILQQKQQMGKA